MLNFALINALSLSEFKSAVNFALKANQSILVYHIYGMILQSTVLHILLFFLVHNAAKL